MELSSLQLYLPGYPHLTLQSCVDAAARNPKGGVFIPASYAGTDSYSNSSNVPIFDLRGTGTLTFGNFSLSRYRVGGTAYSGADSSIVLSAGWGNTAAVSSATGFDEAFSFTVTPNGTGITSNPTITITFKNGSWGNTPQFIVERNDLIAPFGLPPHTISATATTLTITFNGLPNNSGLSYNFTAIGFGN